MGCLSFMGEMLPLKRFEEGMICMEEMCTKAFIFHRYICIDRYIVITFI